LRGGLRQCESGGQHQQQSQHDPSAFQFLTLSKVFSI
jgi:hypothetical protein